MRVDLPTRRATRLLGRAIAHTIEAGDVVLLEGDLGAGKTFLTRAIARALGVSRTTRITSPTFTILHEYALAEGVLLHADLYRLRGPQLEDEVLRLGIRERLVDGAMLIAEWAIDAEHAIGIPPSLVVRLSRHRAATSSSDPASTERSAQLSGPRASDVIARLALALSLSRSLSEL